MCSFKILLCQALKNIPITPALTLPALTWLDLVIVLILILIVLVLLALWDIAGWWVPENGANVSSSSSLSSQLKFNSANHHHHTQKKFREMFHWSQASFRAMMMSEAQCGGQTHSEGVDLVLSEPKA